MKLPRWLVVSMLAASSLAILALVGWWWVTWPERTAATFVRLMNENRWGLAAEMTVTADDHRFIEELGDYIREDGFNGFNPIAERSGFIVRPLPRSLPDILLARQVFGWGMDTSYKVERGKVRVF
jgi:hypothetical protein